MGIELSIKFRDVGWYKANFQFIRDIIKKLPSFCNQGDENELWLKDIKSKNSWDYDLRIFLEEEEIFIEVSAFTSSFYNDINSFYNDISIHCKISLVDDDGEPFCLPKQGHGDGGD